MIESPTPSVRRSRRKPRRDLLGPGEPTEPLSDVARLREMASAVLHSRWFRALCAWTSAILIVAAIVLLTNERRYEAETGWCAAIGCPGDIGSMYPLGQLVTIGVAAVIWASGVAVGAAAWIVLRILDR